MAAAAGDAMVVKTVVPTDRITETKAIKMPAVAGLSVESGTSPTMAVSGTAAKITIWDNVLTEKNFTADDTTGEITLVTESGPTTIDVEVGLLVRGLLPTSSAVLTFEVYADGAQTGVTVQSRNTDGSYFENYYSLIIPGLAIDDVLSIYVSSDASGTLTLDANSQFTVKRLY